MERRAFAKLFGLGAAGAVASVVPMGREETAQARDALEAERVEKTFYKGHVIWWWDEDLERPGDGCWAARRRAQLQNVGSCSEGGDFPYVQSIDTIRSVMVRRRRFAFGRDDRFRREKVEALDWIKRYIDANWTGRA